MPQYIVLYDDNEAVCSPYTWDEDCEGAITGGGWEIARFRSRSEAQRAIKISTAFARLNEAQGKCANEDFLAFRKHVKIRRLAELREDPEKQKGSE